MDVNVDQHVGAVRREVRHGERAGAETRILVATRTYQAAIEDIWAAITSPERLPRWFLPVSGDLRPGGNYQLEGNAGGVIERCEEPGHLALTWEFGGQISWLEVRLQEVDGGVALELAHLALADGHWEQFGPGAGGVGWDMALMGLDLHLQSGEAVDPQASMAWMASEQGRAFIRASSEAWARADVAAGADEAQARAAAARTVAAYTGESAPEPPG